MQDTEYLDVIIAESKGTATEQQIQDLQGDKVRWRNGLIELVEQANNSLTFLQSHFEEDTQDRLDPDEYRRLRVEMKSKRAKTIRFKRAIEDRLRAVNSMLTLERRNEATHMMATSELLDAILQVIDLDGIHQDIPSHLHPVLDQRLQKVS